MEKSLVVVIMAGGLGKRMNSDLPKVLHEIDGEPMLVHVIKQARYLQPRKILIVVGKYREIIEETLTGFIDMNVIEFVTQEQAYGTGHAVMCCIPQLTKYMDSTTLILSGDVPLFKTKTMKELLSTKNRIRIVTTRFENPTGYGRIIEENGVFVKITEEKDCTVVEKNIKTVNCGIYAIDTELLLKYLPLLTNNNAQHEYYLTDVIELVKNGEQCIIETYEISKNNQYEIVGVNTAEQLIDLEKQYKKMV